MMVSELDRRLAEGVRRLTAPGEAFEIGEVDHQGRPVPAFVNAPATLPELFDRCCAEHAGAEFLVDGDVRLSFAETHALARRVAAGLVARHGIRPGDRVGIAAHNSASWIIAYMGVIMAGGCATLLNAWWSGAELAGGVALADCALVLADPPRAAQLEDLPEPPRMAVFDHDHPAIGLAALLAPADEPGKAPALTPDDAATILFTSGSTGIAKAALSDQRAMVQVTMAFAVHAIASYALAGPRPTQHAALLAVPLFHVTGEVALLLASFVLGRRLVLTRRWDAGEAMALIERERVTTLVGVPTMIMDIVRHPLRSAHDLSSCAIIAVGGAPYPAEHLAALGAALPDALHLIGYASTETNCLGACGLDACDPLRLGSTGPASSPLVEIVVVGPDGAPLPAGLRGEVAVRSICNFREYWRNAQETAAALRPDGFFLTGDIGWLDADGYLTVVDRSKDIIIRGGENIASAEVEQAIAAHPAVTEASVFGLPHDRYGEVPVAVYAIRDGHRLGEDELRDHLASRIAPFKIPVRLWRAELALPRLGTQKIDKQSLKVRYSEQWEAARNAP